MIKNSPADPTHQAWIALGVFVALFGAALAVVCLIFLYVGGVP